MLGLFALGMSIVSILSIFLSLGLGNGLIKYVSKYVAKKITFNCTPISEKLLKLLYLCA